MSIERALVCDDCSLVMGAASTAKEARRTINHHRENGRDYCEFCWPERESVRVAAKTEVAL